MESGHSGAETEHTGVRIAHEEQSPVRQVWRRVVFAAAVLAFTVAVIYLDRDGYRDGDTVGLSLLDSIYYATVTLSTTTILSSGVPRACRERIALRPLVP